MQSFMVYKDEQTAPSKVYRHLTLEQAIAIYSKLKRADIFGNYVIEKETK